MSHLKEREAKNCLNCNAQVHGRYCHICGQENVDTRETFWHLLSHFFQDITHFDGKFFSSLKLLITRPGFLSSEYMRGRRASYLNPIRMYVFTSAIFFLVFFSEVNVNDTHIDNLTMVNKVPVSEIRKMDSASFQHFLATIKDADLKNRADFEHYLDSASQKQGLHFTSRAYQTKGEYDSLLASGAKKHSWIQRRLIYKEIELNDKYNNNITLIFNSFLQGFFHRFPQMFFISLPLFALLLKLLYKRRKEFLYVNHGIFSIHLYVFVFIAMLALIGIRELENWVHWHFLTYIRIGGMLAILFYQYKAMCNFYGQGRGKTILKLILLNIASSLMIIILFVLFLFFSFIGV